MGHEINARMWVLQDGVQRELVTYFADEEDDIEALPTFPAIAAASVALVIGTGKVYALTRDGWNPIGG